MEEISAALRKKKGREIHCFSHLPTLSSAGGSHWLKLPKSQNAVDSGKYNFL